MQLGTPENPWCEGRGCALRDKCARFKEKINEHKEYHFAFAPVRQEAKGPACRFLIPKTDNE